MIRNLRLRFQDKLCSDSMFSILPKLRMICSLSESQISSAELEIYLQRLRGRSNEQTQVSAMGPTINIIGSFFPSWMLCAAIGIVAALLGRRLFIRTGLDPYVGPPALVYSSLGILVTLVLWVAFFRG